MMLAKFILIATVICSIAVTAPAACQERAAPTPENSPEAQGQALTPAQQAALRLALIKLSQNPVGNITVVPFQNNFNYGVGPYARYQYNLNVQPVVPIMLSTTLNLIARTILPVLVQPSAASPAVCSASGCGSTFGLGDIQEQLFFAPKTKPGELIWGAGPLFGFPAASPDTLGSGKWTAGVDGVVLVMPGKWVLGILATQQWSYAGQTARPNVNAFLVQPFANLNLPDGWTISSAPSITADWTRHAWAVPLGGGVTKTFKAGDQPMQLSLAYYTYVVKPVNSPQTQLRLQWSLLWPVKRGINMAEILKANQ